MRCGRLRHSSCRCLPQGLGFAFKQDMNYVFLHVAFNGRYNLIDCSPCLGGSSEAEFPLDRHPVRNYRLYFPISSSCTAIPTRFAVLGRNIPFILNQIPTPWHLHMKRHAPQPHKFVRISLQYKG